MSNYQPVAIVGLGSVLPDALDPQTFWQNIRMGWSSIREVPKNRWRVDLYYDPDPNVPDKTYSKLGAWVEGFKLEPQKLGLAIPPKVIDEMEETQKWAIVASHQALTDYGYPRRQLDPARVAVILGNLLAGEKHYITGLRVRLPEYIDILKSVPEFRDLPGELQTKLVNGLLDGVHAKIPASTEDTLPGELGNVIAGRVANLFNFSGPNFTTDAACASSQAAIQTAIEGLCSDQYDAVLTGGVDRNMGPDGFVKFCKIGALSPDGSRPYSAGANGFIMGEGAVIFLLKRLADAERDGDRIYAVIRGVGGSSDGKGKGITAPNPVGQMKAIERAWKNAGLSPATASLIEGHGTATVVGDIAEVEALNAVFQPFGLPTGSIPLGSVKSNIGHLKGAAGAVSLLKTVFALHDRILPPSINFDQPNPQIDFAHSPFRVNTTTHPWEISKDQVRRAGISSFGFGGTNFHMVVEEYIPGIFSDSPHQSSGISFQKNEIVNKQLIEPTREESASSMNLAPRVEGFNIPIPTEAKLGATPAPDFYRSILFLGGKDLEELISKLGEAINQAREGNLRNSTWPSQDEYKSSIRLTIKYENNEDLIKKAEKTIKALQTDDLRTWQSLAGQGVFRAKGDAGKVAFLFPGQGSQYPNMLRDLCAVESVVDETFKEADAVMTPILGRTLTSYIFVNDDPESIAEAEAALKETSITQPAVLTANVALLRLMQKYGFYPDMAIGHSLGEYAALVAAGVLSFPDALEIVSNRGRAMAKVSLDDNGCMAAVSAPIAEVERILNSIDGYVVIANINSPVQAVIGGATKSVDAAIAAFEAEKFQAVKIPVSHAFHTAIVAPSSQPLREMISRMNIQKPTIPVIANVTGEVYPNSHDEIIEMLSKQVASPVQFVKSMAELYSLGARVFVEIGPKRVLNALAVDNLKERTDVTILATNHPRKGAVVSFNEAIAGLLAAGVRNKYIQDNSRVPASSEIGEIQPSSPEKSLDASAEVRIDANLNGTDEIKMFLLKNVSEKTGYPIEMLDLDLDLEADLGIDSIKQAELFQSVREKYDVPRPDGLSLADYNTLAKVQKFIINSLEKKQNPPFEQPQVRKDEPQPADQDAIVYKEVINDPLEMPIPAIRRRKVVPVARPRLDLCKETGITLHEGQRILVIKNGHKAGNSLARLLQTKGIKIYSLNETAPQKINDQIEKILSEGQLDGIYFLSSESTDSHAGSTYLHGLQSALDDGLYRMYRLFRVLTGQPFLICASFMGGTHGYGSNSGANPFDGAVRGFAKAIRRERPGMLVKVIDFEIDPEPVKIALRLVDETLHDPDAYEVGWYHDNRYGIYLAEESYQGLTVTPLPQGLKFLISGGSGGIVGPIIQDLARTTRGTFYLLGRTPIPDRSDPAIIAVRQNREGLRHELLKEYPDTKDRAVQAEVENRLAAVDRKSALIELMSQIEAAGATVEYFSCDITDKLAIYALIQKILLDAGKIDIFIHAAGIEITNRLEKKSFTEFQQTIDVKDVGFKNIIETFLTESRLPSTVIGFSSVAGRFGNSGQSDYSAANDLLGCMILNLAAKYPGTRGLVFDWGPWAEVGMASRGYIPKLMKMGGVDMLNPHEASLAVRAELMIDGSREILLSGSLGVLESGETVKSVLDLDQANNSLSKAEYHLLGRVKEFSEEMGYEFEVELDPQKEKFLHDHSIGQTPLLPGVIGIQGFIQASDWLAGNNSPESKLLVIHELTNVQFISPLKFFRNQPRSMTWHIRQVFTETGTSVLGHLISQQQILNHEPESIINFTARLDRRIMSPHDQRNKEILPASENSKSLVREEIYKLFFHGESFQVLNRVTRSRNSIVGEFRPQKGYPSNDFTSPDLTLLFIELLLQTAGVWDIGETGTLALPSFIEKLIVYPFDHLKSPIAAVITPDKSHPEKIAYDGFVLSTDGKVIVEMSGYRTSSVPFEVDPGLLLPFKQFVAD